MIHGSFVRPRSSSEFSNLPSLIELCSNHSWERTKIGILPKKNVEFLWLIFKTFSVGNFPNILIICLIENECRFVSLNQSRISCLPRILRLSLSLVLGSHKILSFFSSRREIEILTGTRFLGLWLFRLVVSTRFSDFQFLTATKLAY